MQIRFDIDDSGETKNVKVLESAHACLNSAARRVVKKWRFSCPDGAPRNDVVIELPVYH